MPRLAHSRPVDDTWMTILEKEPQQASSSWDPMYQMKFAFSAGTQWIGSAEQCVRKNRPDSIDKLVLVAPATHP
eukprot:9764641-Karenia_brevis.AAC.1